MQSSPVVVDAFCSADDCYTFPLLHRVSLRSQWEANKGIAPCAFPLIHGTT